MTAFSYGHHNCISPAASKLLAGVGHSVGVAILIDFVRLFVNREAQCKSSLNFGDSTVTAFIRY